MPVKTSRLEGQRFGKLTVLKDSGERRNRFVMWLCLCDCGRYTKVRTSGLITGHTKSCGCSHDFASRQCTKPHGRTKQKSTYEVGVKAAWKRFKYRAKRYNKKVNLRYSEFLDLIFQNCFYCGSSPNNRVRSAKGFRYQGIDRVDSSKGYSKNNVVPCCGLCNRAKHKLSLKRFLAWLDQVALYRKNFNLKHSDVNRKERK